MGLAKNEHMIVMVVSLVWMDVIGAEDLEIPSLLNGLKKDLENAVLF